MSNNTMLLTPQKIEMFRIRYADGKYAAGSYKKTKKGKVWLTRSHLHQHFAQFSHSVTVANNYKRPWVIYPKDIKHFQDKYNGAVIVNETTGEEVDALPYIDNYFRNIYKGFHG